MAGLWAIVMVETKAAERESYWVVQMDDVRVALWVVTMAASKAVTWAVLSVAE